MADQTPTESLTTQERFVGWLRFLVFLIGLMMATSSAVQVYEHWEPANADVLSYAISSFAHYLWPRLLIGAAIGAVFLGFVMLFRQRPPWIDAD